MRGWLAFAAALMSMLAAVPSSSQVPLPSDAPLQLSAAQVSEAGVQAIRAGQTVAALQLADALLAHDPHDPFAYFLKSAAYSAQTRLPEAQDAARLAFRHAQSPEQHFQAARATALAAYGQQRFGAAQWWLRRAISFAPDDARRGRSIAEFNSVRGKNPLSLDLRFSVSPSDNVNNGSSGAFNIIDGVPYVGILSPDARQMAGVITDSRVDVRYRVRQSATTATVLGFAAYLRDVAFSAEAKKQLSGVAEPASDLQRLEVKITHSLVPGDASYRLDIGATVGRRWQGALEPQDLARLTAGSTIAIGERTVLDFAIATERRTGTNGTTAADRVDSLRAGWQQEVPGAGRLAALVFVSAFGTSSVGQSSTTLGAEVAFQPKRDLGPLRLSVSFGMQHARFDDYSVAGIVVPGGRTDQSTYGEVQVLFPDAEISGFAPHVSLRRQQTHSNVSRFDAGETSFSLGVKSTF